MTVFEAQVACFIAAVHPLMAFLARSARPSVCSGSVYLRSTSTQFPPPKLVRSTLHILCLSHLKCLAGYIIFVRWHRGPDQVLGTLRSNLSNHGLFLAHTYFYRSTAFTFSPATPADQIPSHLETPFCAHLIGIAYRFLGNPPRREALGR